MAKLILDATKILREFSGVAPVFPLPSLVLFPDTIVPLLIFEDRYRAMVKDALEGERLIAMALLKPGWETQYDGNPPFHERICVGTIVNHERLADGRYKMLLYGLFRAEVVEEVQTSPYRKVRVAVTNEEVRESQVVDLDQRLHRALDMIPGRRGRVGRLRRLAEDVRGRDGGLGRLADAAAEAADLEAEERYRILAEPDVLRRLDLLISMLDRKTRSGPDALPPRVDSSLN
jgi:Lon protease-like protein